MNYREFLLENADRKYLQFNKRLINSKYPMIGVRTPVLRRYALTVSRNGLADDFLSRTPEYYEEVLLNGFLRAEKDDVIANFGAFLPYIDNWAVCDMVVSSFSGIKKIREEFLAEFSRLRSGGEFERRALLVALKCFYLNDEYIGRALKLAAETDCDRYYVSMAAAWLLAEAMVNYYDKVKPLMTGRVFGEQTVCRAAKKAAESFRIDDIKKAWLKQAFTGKTKNAISPTKNSSPSESANRAKEASDFKRKYFAFYDDIKISDREDW